MLRGYILQLLCIEMIQYPVFLQSKMERIQCSWAAWNTLKLAAWLNLACQFESAFLVISKGRKQSYFARELWRRMVAHLPRGTKKDSSVTDTAQAACVCEGPDAALVESVGTGSLIFRGHKSRAISIRNLWLWKLVPACAGVTVFWTPHIDISSVPLKEISFNEVKYVAVLILSYYLFCM